MKRGHRGFTLLEVLVALAIFAMVAVVLGAAYINVLMGYQQAGRDNADDLDVAFARQQIMTQPDMPTAEKGDEFTDTDGKLVTYSSDIEPTTTADLFTVTLTCAISAPQAASRTVTQTFMLLRPTWSDAADRSNLRQQAATRIAKLQGKEPQ
jgi:general secretion pathway protein I